MIGQESDQQTEGGDEVEGQELQETPALRVRPVPANRVDDKGLKCRLSGLMWP